MSIKSTIRNCIFILITIFILFRYSNAQEIKSSFPQEKIFMHTDKDAYLAGEILWFKLYCVNALNQHPVYWSKVAYVELINSESKPVWQGKVSLKSLDKQGSYHLPLSLNSGNYILRAYTNLMRNQGPDHFFQKQVTIINTLKNNTSSNFDTSVHYAIQFFPEGGKLINGASTIIGFKIIDSYGRGVNGRGYILSGPTDTLLAFRSLKFGMGHFKFTPFEDVKYRAVIILDNGNFITADLPKIYDHGFVMNVNSVSDQYVIDVKSNLGQGNEDQDLYLVTHSADGKESKNLIHLQNGAARISTSKNSLGEGIITCTLFDDEQNPLCERILFNTPNNKQRLVIRANRNEYSTREPVKIMLDDTNAKDSLADLSISVWKIDSLSQIPQSNIENYLLFSSELKGDIDSIEYYFSKDSEVSEATENLLLTQGWRTFKDVDHKANHPTLVYPLEYNGQVLQVKVTDSRTNQPAENIQTFLSVPGTNYRFYSVVSDKNGIAKFELPELYGYNELIVQTNTQKDSFYHIEVLSPFAQEGTNRLPSFTLKTISLSDVENESISMQAQNIYHAEKLRNFSLPVLSDTLPFYGKPAKSYDLDNYTRFTTMEEVFREYVSEINVGVRGGHLVFKMMNENQHEYKNEDVLMLLDGIPVMDHNKIFEYDPLKVKKLDVIPQNYILGPSTFSGIASFVTYEGNYKGFELDPGTVVFDYDALQLRREFYSPAYTAEDLKHSRLPDFRSTLFWSPHFQPVSDNKPFTFYTSDVKGKFMILVQGINSDGNLVHSTAVFDVK